MRKAVLSKQTTVFYTVDSQVAHLTFIHLNKMDFSETE
jgi:hypothetical protein